jgi:hypothetical protein
MSTSQDGLQCKLNKLQACCDDWGIDVNHFKTNTMIFNQTGKYLKENILFKSKPLDCVYQYTYLGITLTPSGSFQEAKLEFYTEKHLKTFLN